MLEAIRERTGGWLAGVIIGLLVIPFAFWGIQNYFQAGSDAYVAKVNKQEITYSEYREALGDYQARMRSMLGEQYDAGYFETPIVKRQVLDGVIQQAVLKQYLDAQGYSSSIEQVRDAILAVDAFNTDGKFDPDLYRALLSQRRMTPEMFQSLVADDLKMQQLPTAISASSFISDPELDLILKAQKQTRSFEYLILAASDYREEVQVEDADVQSYYDTHQEDYMIPERVKIDYLEVNAKEIESKIVVDDEMLMQRYEARADYTVPERRKAAHILIEVSEGSDAETVASAKSKADELLNKLQSGDDFSQIAKQSSDDPGSKDSGGDLGWIGAGEMVPAFENAVNELTDVGQLSGLVKTEYGFHIIKLTDFTEEHRKTFEETRAELEKDYREEKADEQYLDIANQLGSLTYESIDSLEPAAEALGLEVKSLDFFSRSFGPGIASDEKLRNAAFSDEVLENGQNSDPIDLADNNLVVIRVTDRDPSHAKAFDEVKAVIKNRLISDAASELASVKLDEYLGLFGSGETSDKELTVSGLVARDDKESDRSVLAEVFKLESGSVGSFIRKDLPANRYLAVKVTEIKDVDISGVNAEDRKSLRDQLVVAAGRAEWASFIEGLQQKATIVVQEENLQ